MLAIFDDIPTSTSLLMQCGYRSKVCTNVRATKIDGSLHKLCEFHRRKANANQQRLHQRQREQRVKRRRTEETTEQPMKKICQDIVTPIALDPIPYTNVVPTSPEQHYPMGFFSDELASSTVDVELLELLELLLFDTQSQSLDAAQKLPPNSPVSVDSVVV
ncbi:hypothetical protein P3T76_005362 [Phytophthora citrophthora]|uniref:Uncharacterized protein n=1 Tax=Phytophthora citrophthora TaxID=4793 RepID=A0AAD9GTQ5_9STRA|nr:hypothetical protein P3T76_005362 [Phytophthora citrophthora]